MQSAAKDKIRLQNVDQSSQEAARKVKFDENLPNRFYKDE